MRNHFPNMFLWEFHPRYSQGRTLHYVQPGALVLGYEGSTISLGKVINLCYPQESHFHGNSRTKPTQHSNKSNHELHLLDGVEFYTDIVNYENS
jgi:hypothetical protein